MEEGCIADHDSDRVKGEATIGKVEMTLRSIGESSCVRMNEKLEGIPVNVKNIEQKVVKTNAQVVDMVSISQDLNKIVTHSSNCIATAMCYIPPGGIEYEAI